MKQFKNLHLHIKYFPKFKAWILKRFIRNFKKKKKADTIWRKRFIFIAACQFFFNLTLRTFCSHMGAIKCTPGVQRFDYMRNKVQEVPEPNKPWDLTLSLTIWEFPPWPNLPSGAKFTLNWTFLTSFG